MVSNSLLSLVRLLSSVSMYDSIAGRLIGLTCTVHRQTHIVTSLMGQCEITTKLIMSQDWLVAPAFKGSHQYNTEKRHETAFRTPVKEDSGQIMLLPVFSDFLPVNSNIQKVVDTFLFIYFFGRNRSRMIKEQQKQQRMPYSYCRLIIISVIE